MMEIRLLTYSNTFRVQWSSAPSWGTLDSDLDGTSDQAEAAAGTDAFGFADSASDNSEFTAIADFAGWTANAAVNAFEVNGGALRGSIIAGDPQLSKTDFDFDGNSALQIRVRYKHSSNGTVDFYWGNRTDDSFSGDRQLSTTYTGAGDWQELVFDLGREPQWLDQVI